MGEEKEAMWDLDWEHFQDPNAPDVWVVDNVGTKKMNGLVDREGYDVSYAGCDGGHL